MDDDGSDSDSPLSPGPEGESEAHHRCIIMKNHQHHHFCIEYGQQILISAKKVKHKLNIKMCRKRKSERGGKPRRARTAFTYEQLVRIGVDVVDKLY